MSIRLNFTQDLAKPCKEPERRSEVGLAQDEAIGGRRESESPRTSFFTTVTGTRDGLSGGGSTFTTLSSRFAVGPILGVAFAFAIRLPLGGGFVGEDFTAVGAFTSFRGIILLGTGAFEVAPSEIHGEGEVDCVILDFAALTQATLGITGFGGEHFAEITDKS